MTSLPPGRAEQNGLGALQDSQHTTWREWVHLKPIRCSCHRGLSVDLAHSKPNDPGRAHLSRDCRTIPVRRHENGVPILRVGDQVLVGSVLKVCLMRGPHLMAMAAEPRRYGRRHALIDEEPRS